MTKHLAWIWVWFFIGMGMYWLKRGYYLITGPNPVASNWKQFIQRCWVPLIVRMFLDGLAFWFFFIPGAGSKILGYFGWSSYEWGILMATQFAPVAAAFGHTIDSLLDFAVSKVPFLKDWLPQMPPPLKQ